MKFKEKLKEKFKKIIICCNNENGTTKMDQSVKQSPQKPRRSLAKTCVNIIHKFLVLIVRCFLKYVYGEHGAKMPPIKNLILLESATSLALKIRTRKLTSVEVTKAFIERVKEVNPLLNCVVDECFAEALKDAEKADKLVESGTFTVEELAQEKPFLGVPISTKDCIKVKGLLHTAGIHLRKDVRGDADAQAMALMRKAGAIPFALTNVSECCMWWESANPNHGRTKNPYDVNRIVGGSSGGEGCIQAAAASVIGLGSDIGGSIRMPAFFNGIFGHKPSKFIVSNDGQYPEPLDKEQDSFLGIGPMCRYATDLKPVLKVIADSSKLKDLRLDEPVDLKQLKIFYQHNDGGALLVTPVDLDIKESMDKVVAHFKQTIKTDVKKVSIEKLRKSAPIWLANMKTKEEIPFACQLANLKGSINPYWELLKLCVGQSNHSFVALLTCLTDSNGVKYGTPKHHHMVKQRDELLQEFQTMLGDNGVFIYPCHPTPAPYHYEPLIRAFNFSYTAIINVLGLPATSVPLGLGKEGLPIGLQVVANVNQDRLCLAVACELERAFGGWVAPEVLA
uniref:Putative amidase n=1 Tax=Corethrella appendiculata TaxID=1370023 RepID=U5EVA0_9DIPT